MGEQIMVTPNQRQRRTRRTRGARVGFLTPNQLADRLIQLSAQWHVLARQEITATGNQNPPSLIALKKYDKWALGVSRNPADFVLQSDTLKRYDEYRAIYGAHRARVAGILGKAPQAMSLEEFDRDRTPFWGGMPWWGWLIAAGLGYLVIREVSK